MKEVFFNFCLIIAWKGKLWKEREGIFDGQLEEMCLCEWIVWNFSGK